MLPLRLRVLSEEKKQIQQRQEGQDKQLKQQPTTGLGNEGLASFYFKPDACVHDHRDPVIWKKWLISKEHSERVLSLLEQDPLEKLNPIQLKKNCRHGSLPAETRRFTWLSVLGVHPKSKEYQESLLDYRSFLRDKVMSCPGCAELNHEHIHRYGARFLSNSSLWEENLFDKHALSKVGLESLKRLLLVLHCKWHLDYAPQIPDVACILLLYLSEEDAFACLNKMICSSRVGKRWTKEKTGVAHFFPIGRLEARLFVKTFLDLVKERLPMVFRSLHDIGRDEEEVESLFQGWFERMFVGLLPLRFIIRLVDCWMIEGAKVLYRIGLTLLKNSRSYLLEECTKYKKGAIALSDLFEGCLDVLGSNHESRRTTLEMAKFPLKEESRPIRIKPPFSPIRARSKPDLEDDTNKEELETKHENQGKPMSENADNSVGSSSSYSFLRQFEKKKKNEVGKRLQSPKKGRRTSKLFQLFDFTESFSDAKQDFTVNPIKENNDGASENMGHGIAALTQRVREGSLYSATESRDGDEWLLKEEEEELGILSVKVDDFSDSDSVVSCNSLHAQRSEPCSPLNLRNPGLSSELNQEASSSHGTLLSYGVEMELQHNSVNMDSTLSSPKFKALDPEILREVKNMDQSSLMVINELTVGRKKATGGNEEANQSFTSNESIIILQNRFGSKRFYSENSLLHCSSVAGTTMLNKVVGDAPIVHSLDSAVDNFEFKVFLGSAFGWRNLTSKMLFKRDELNRKVLAKEGAPVFASDSNAPAHFPKGLISDSCILTSVRHATKLVSWFPIKYRLATMKIRRLYTTNEHGRSLQSLYEMCNLPNIAASVIIIQTLRLDGTEGSIFGGFINGVFSPTYRESYGEECFLFRLTPDKVSRAWNFAGSVDFAGINVGAITPRSRLRNFSKVHSSERIEPLSQRRKSIETVMSDSVAEMTKNRLDHNERRRSVASIDECQDVGASSLLFDDHLEQEARINFASCDSTCLRFGTTSTVFLSSEDRRIDPEDVSNLSDLELEELGLHEGRVGPGLWLADNLNHGHTGWCNTYRNEPLCSSQDCVRNVADKFQSFFQVANVEVFGIPFW